MFFRHKTIAIQRFGYMGLLKMWESEIYDKFVVDVHPIQECLSVITRSPALTESRFTFT